MIPKDGWSNRVFQIIPITAGVIKNGIRTNILHSFRNGNLLFNNKEKQNPRMRHKIRESAVIRIVLPII